jgi:hypothetical protein
MTEACVEERELLACSALSLEVRRQTFGQGELTAATRYAAVRISARPPRITMVCS